MHYGGFNNAWNDYLTGKFSLTVTPVKNLTITGVYAPTMTFGKGKKFLKQVPYYDADDPSLMLGYINGCITNSLEETRNDNRTATKQLLINYSLETGRHSLALMAGYEDYYSFAESLSASTDQMELSEYPYLDRGNKNFWDASGNASEYGYRSYFGRVNYAFADQVPAAGQHPSRRVVALPSRPPAGRLPVVLGRLGRQRGVVPQGLGSERAVVP